MVSPDDCDGLLTVKVLKPLNRILHTRGFVAASLFVLIPLVGMVSLVVGLQGLAYSEYSLLHTGLRSSGRSRSLRAISIIDEITTTSDNTQYITDLDVDSLPECAQDVIVTLYNEEDEDDEPSCKGLLIRDDTILTSNACSKSTYTFDFLGVGVIDASPHTLLNAKMERKEGSSPLGFLEVNLPYHYQQQSTRVYLSKTSPVMNDETNSEDGDEKEKAVIMTCGEKQHPIAYSFPVMEKMIPLKSLVEILGDEIPWEGKGISSEG